MKYEFQGELNLKKNISPGFYFSQKAAIVERERAQFIWLVEYKALSSPGGMLGMPC